VQPIGCCGIPTVTGKSIAKGWTWRSRVPTRVLERRELRTGKLVRAVLRGGGDRAIISLPNHLFAQEGQFVNRLFGVGIVKLTAGAATQGG
jgi:hypothetical protein